jgi:hypothetical protein
MIRRRRRSWRLYVVVVVFTVHDLSHETKDLDELVAEVGGIIIIGCGGGYSSDSDGLDEAVLTIVADNVRQIG